MKNAPLIDELRERLAERILFLDGALGTMVQGHAMEEAAGLRRRILTSTQPDEVIRLLSEALAPTGHEAKAA